MTLLHSNHNKSFLSLCLFSNRQIETVVLCQSAILCLFVKSNTILSNRKCSACCDKQTVCKMIWDKQEQGIKDHRDRVKEIELGRKSDSLKCNFCGICLKTHDRGSLCELRVAYSLEGSCPRTHSPCTLSQSLPAYLERERERESWTVMISDNAVLHYVDWGYMQAWWDLLLSDQQHMGIIKRKKKGKKGKHL